MERIPWNTKLQLNNELQPEETVENIVVVNKKSSIYFIIVIVNVTVITIKYASDISHKEHLIPCIHPRTLKRYVSSAAINTATFAADSTVISYICELPNRVSGS